MSTCDIKIQKNQKTRSLLGFTLVELIVVITILVILGTIAFVSLSGFSGSARDSSRVSDLSLISKGLAVTLARNGTYPDPTAWTGITYSWGTVWKQGTMGDSVISQISGFWVRMSKKPVDPLSSTEYTYSITTESKEYSLKADYEGSKVGYGKIPPAPFTKGEFAFSPFVKGVTNGESRGISDIVPEIFADTGNPTIAYIAGNYNGIATKVTVGSPKTVYLIAIPNIVTPTSVTGITIGSSQNFIVNGQNNTGGVSFTPKVIYQSGALPSNDTEKVLFASGVISAYSGTVLASNSNISQMIANVNNTGTLASVWGGVVNMVWGGSPVSTIMPAPIYSWSLSGSTWIFKDDSNRPLYPAGCNQLLTNSGTFFLSGSITASGSNFKDGFYFINPTQTSTGIISAYCDMLTNSGGWIVVFDSSSGGLNNTYNTLLTVDADFPACVTTSYSNGYLFSSTSSATNGCNWGGHVTDNKWILSTSYNSYIVSMDISYNWWWGRLWFDFDTDPAKNYAIMNNSSNNLVYLYYPNGTVTNESPGKSSWTFTIKNISGDFSANHTSGLASSYSFNLWNPAQKYKLPLYIQSPAWVNIKSVKVR